MYYQYLKTGASDEDQRADVLHSKLAAANMHAVWFRVYLTIQDHGLEPIASMPMMCERVPPPEDD